METFQSLAAPLLETFALQRLQAVSFLGLLSPRFVDAACPLVVDIVPGTCDGSRFDHSVAVAQLLYELFQRLEPDNLKLQTYAVAWGLLHDVATWPLSHTSEPAFEQATGVSARRLREMMILGSPTLPEHLTVWRPLRCLGLDPMTMNGLFDKHNSPRDPELKSLWYLVHCPATPDTLEGINRAGSVFGIKVPNPNGFVELLETSDADFQPLPGFKEWITDFWKAKSQVYELAINRPDVVMWESSWSFSIAQTYSEMDLVQSLELDENEVIAHASQHRRERLNRIYRYKEPMKYYVSATPGGKGFYGILETLKKVVESSCVYEPMADLELQTGQLV